MANMEHGDLWARWSQHYRNLGHDPKRITQDGILHPEKFNSDRRVLFILKDSNNFPGGKLADLLKNGPVHAMWHVAARWAAGILNGFPEFQDIDNRRAMTEALHQIAVVNLKKITGGAGVSHAVVNAYAHQDRRLLLEQIDAIAPKVILACGVFDPLVWLLDLAVEPCKDKEPARSKHNGAWVIPWRHPNRASNRKTYAELKELWAGLGDV